VAARTLPKKIANRPKTMFRASMSGTFLGPGPAGVGRPAPQPRVAPATGYFDPEVVARERAMQVRIPRITIKRAILDVG
jgi:asparagine synthase (glutamine-hydrolysing)